MLKAKLLGKFKTPVVTLNKKLIIVIACMLLLVFLIIIVNALDESNSRPPSSTIHSQGAAQANKDALASLNTLPASYTSAGQINSILNRSVNGLSPQAKQLIDNLQQQLTSIQANQKTDLPPTSPNNYSSLDSEANSSSIFFAGGAPAPQNQQQDAQTAAAAAANKTAAQNTAPPAASDAYATQNMQGQKLDFLTSQPTKDIYDTNTVQYPASPYILQAGSIIPAVLQTKISTDLPGMITALVSQDVYDSIKGEYLLIPSGSKLIGEYNSNVSYGQSQVQVKFTRLIRPDGTSIVLPNQAGIDSMGTSGIEDDVNNHWGAVIGSAVLSAIFNIPAIVATNQMNNASQLVPNGTGGYNQQQGLGSTAGASALQSVGQAASTLGTALTTRSLNIQPTVIINAGYQFSVMVSKDIVLPPYTADNTGP